MFDMIAQENNTYTYSFSGRTPTLADIDDAIYDARRRGVPQEAIVTTARDNFGKPTVIFEWTSKTVTDSGGN